MKKRPLWVRKKISKTMKSKGIKISKDIWLKGLEVRRKLIKEGKIKPWNKGLTKETDRRVLNNANKVKIAHKNYKPTFGGKHNNGHKYVKREIRERISKKLINHKVKKKTRDKIKEARAKQIFPIKDSKIEIKIQEFLKQLGIQFFTHQYISEIKHSYQCDIFIPIMNLIIECDGDYWHSYPTGTEIDHIRTKELIEQGFKVLRLWESEIKEMDINRFKKKIMEV